MIQVKALKYIRNAAVTLTLTSVPAVAVANDFNADKVLNEMAPQEQSAYIAGVIEGLAIARYMKDGKQSAGMNCIYDFYYDDKANIRTILAAFEKYGSYPPGSIIDVLVKQKCGE